MPASLHVRSDWLNAFASIVTGTVIVAIDCCAMGRVLGVMTSVRHAHDMFSMCTSMRILRLTWITVMMRKETIASAVDVDVKGRRRHRPQLHLFIFLSVTRARHAVDLRRGR